MCIYSHETAGLLADTDTANTSEYACSVSLYIIPIYIGTNMDVHMHIQINYMHHACTYTDRYACMHVFNDINIHTCIFT
jgi:hypothetical protein